MIKLNMLSLPVTAAFAGVIVIGGYVLFGGPSQVPRKKKKKGTTIPGLANIGNSCFLNAIVQALASCPHFCSWLSTKASSSSPVLLRCLHNLLKVLNNEGNADENACAGEVLKALLTHGWVIAPEEQDAHELFHALTSTLDDELNKKSNSSLFDLSWLPLNETPVVHYSPTNYDNEINNESQFYSSSFDKSHHDGVYSKVAVDYEQSKHVEIIDTSLNNRRTNGIESSSLSTTNNSPISDDLHKTFQVAHFQSSISSSLTNNDRNNINTSECDKEPKVTMFTSNRCNCVESKLEHSQYCDKCLSNGKDIEDLDSESYVSVTIEEKQLVESITNDSYDIDGNLLFETSIAKKKNKLQNSINRHSFLNKNKSLEKCFLVTRIGNSLLKESKLDYPHLYNSQNVSPFRGYLASQLQCNACGVKNPEQWSSFESLSLFLPTMSLGEPTLENLLDTYIAPERVTDVNCNTCSKAAGTNINTSFIKRLTIGKLPVCLCFHIQRTSWLDNGRAVKWQDRIIFPKFLNMTPYTYTASVCTKTGSGLIGGREVRPLINNLPSGGITTGAVIQDSRNSLLSLSAMSRQTPNSKRLILGGNGCCDHMYRLRAVVVHIGDVFSGHFVTYRSVPTLGDQTKQTWYYTSDSSVREVSYEEVCESSAYMMLYEKL